ncbi:MAG: cupredoxin domain-containing protein [Dehalococcoidia bacterium]
MSSKGKRRRDERRKRKQRQGSSIPAHTDADAAEEASPPQPVEAPSKIVRKKRKKKGGRPGLRINPWWIAAPVVVGVIALIGVLIATSGSSGVTAPKVETTPDPRVAGLTPVQTIPINAGGGAADAFFDPRNISGPVGEPLEIVLTNIGSVSHNLTLAGVDGQYDTPDDWVTDPLLITPGETGSVIVKIDEPGTYSFRCVIHPTLQTGELTLG